MQKEETDLRDRTKAFALRIVRMFSALPKTTEAQVLGKQLLRSGTSIGANYREAFRARSKAEFIAKCGDSLREIEEWSVLGNRDIGGPRDSGRAAGEAASQSAYWLELLVGSGVVSTEKLAPLRQEWSQREAVRHRRAARTGERLGERESMRRADRDFRYHSETSEDFLIHFLILPSSFFLSQSPR